ncbi:xanthine dehydrogenase family protein subunit M [Aquincola sp. S2]|uniref:Xanthine dehydrogenase family protein subunit M n=1 Tax=Pseudaquabacterium terrae TaxID=2732868 RepID=A0ABX2ELE4_9BURK|nr:xanthine dehydrogenase family protein subunit M [Aquabacterium terrae]NRF69477.1 xanthine dehydrogenase family protein subunit M [Aquabacterium terrae]
MQAFAYSNPASVADAAKAAAGANAKILAGGQSLLPAMKLGLAAPEALVDLSQIAELKGITVSGNVVKIGAMTTHAQVAASAEVAKAIPALADLASHIGDRQVRNRGTIGGSLANNDPAACYPAAVLGLGATIHTNTRTIAADAFFTGLYETALKEGEIITAVSFPVPEKAAWQKFKQPASRFSIVGVFVSKGAQGVRVAVTGAGACVFRAKELEAKLASNWSGAALQGASFPPDGLNTDLHGSAEYRAALIPVLAQRAVAAT